MLNIEDFAIFSVPIASLQTRPESHRNVPGSNCIHYCNCIHLKIMVPWVFWVKKTS